MPTESKPKFTGQICDGYSPRSFMGKSHIILGNWFEESFAVNQPVRENAEKIVRQGEPDISFKDSTGKLTFLSRISRFQAWNTKGLVETINGSRISDPNPNSNSKPVSIMKESYDFSTLNNFHKNWKSRPYNKENEPIENGKTHAQLHKVNNNYGIFNQNNIEQLQKPRVADETSFRSELKQNPLPKNKYSIYDSGHWKLFIRVAIRKAVATNF